MKWNNEDLEKYLSAKEYIDTAIIPVQAFHLSDEKSLKQDAFNRELLAIYKHELETELSGRLLLIPTYHYLKTDDVTNEIDRLKSWVDNIQQQPFKEVFILTFDTSWKRIERKLPCHLIWLPGMKVTDTRSEEAGHLIRSQVDQISELIRSYW